MCLNLGKFIPMPLFFIPTYFSHWKRGCVLCILQHFHVQNTILPARKAIWNAVIKRASLNNYEFISP